MILYALRYEKAAPQKIKGFIDALKNQGGSEQTVESMLAFAGSNFRLEPMSSVDKLFESTKTIFKGLKV